MHASKTTTTRELSLVFIDLVCRDADGYADKGMFSVSTDRGFDAKESLGHFGAFL
jgi:hypothetical protein